MKLIARQDIYLLAVVGLILILRSLRLSRLNQIVARSAAVAAYRLSGDKRRRVEENLVRLLGGGEAAAERQRIVRRVFYETWRELLSWADPDAISPTSAVDVHGLENLRAALAAGHGAILWESNGFGRRTIMKRALRAHGIVLHQVHGPNDLGGFLLREPPSVLARRIIRPYFDKLEKHFVAANVYIPQSNSLAFARTLIGTLDGTSVLCVSGDGEIGRNRIDGEFLSARFSLATGAVSLARLSGAPLLPVFCFEAEGRSCVMIGEPLPAPRGASRASGFELALGQYVKLLDNYVRRYPEQYRNWHLLGEDTRR